uniref:Phosphatidylinositol 3-kinase catalytic subunit type 3 n=2 Tax=Panagrellus redivivus TaxID=6233 RepID=A0A7E4UXK9_PANRE
MPLRPDYQYAYSCDLVDPVSIKITSLVGVLDRCYNGRQPLSTDMSLRVNVYCNDRRVGPEVQTAYQPPKQKSTNGELHCFNEMLQLPVLYSELSRDAFLHFTLWGADRKHGEIFIAEAKEPLFSKHGVLHSRSRTLPMSATTTGAPTDYNTRGNAATKPLSSEPRSPSSPNPGKLDIVPPQPRRNGRMFPSAPTSTELTKSLKQYNSHLIERSFIDNRSYAKAEQIIEDNRKENRQLSLVVDYPELNDGKRPFNVVHYNDGEDDDTIMSTALSESVGGLIAGSYCLHDPDLDRENLHEAKHQMITRNSRAEAVDKLLVPNTVAKAELEAIIKDTSSELTVEKRDLLWKFRYYLQSNPDALTKFVRCVNWDNSDQHKQASAIVNDWKPTGISHVLELLGRDFPQPFVREYAVSRLKACQSCEDEVLLYLPQLVQALRYEPRGAPRSPEKTLSSYLIAVAKRYKRVASFLYWFVKIEKQRKPMSDESADVTAFGEFFDQLYTALDNDQIKTFKEQERFVDKLNELSDAVQRLRDDSKSKEKYLIGIASEDTFLQNLNGLPLPLDPRVRLKRVLPKKARVFASSLNPIALTFEVEGPPGVTGDDNTYTFIYKRGDDLRQDQLIIQMICVMDGFLCHEFMSLHLTPYAILATSPEAGFVQYIDATPIQNLAKDFPKAQRNDTIRYALQYHRPSKNADGIEEDAMARFVRSCAAYSVISYLLGIGDRHLHNVLLCNDGRIFHIDFGYILGNDPKPFQAPMRITPQMVNAMGGFEGRHFKTFRELFRNIFLNLHGHAKLLSNLFGLMLDAGIPAIEAEKDKAVQKLLERFHLDLSGEALERQIDLIIDGAKTDFGGFVSDAVHGIMVG